MGDFFIWMWENKMEEFFTWISELMFVLATLLYIRDLKKKVKELEEASEKEKHDHSERDHSKREPPKYRGEPLFSANLTWAVVAIGLLVIAIIAIAVLTSL